jgi:putative peptide zinc metalloprotease protein
LFNPDAMLNRVAPCLAFPFRGPWVALGLAFVAAAVGLVVTHWGDFLDRLPSYQELLTPQHLLCLWLAVGVAKVLHELGHGLCCKAQGGEVHDMGLLLLAFFPALYCDVTDSWMLASRWRRMAVAAAGIYVDLLVAAAAAFLWWQSAPGTLVHDLSFGLLAVCGISTLAWNANPLLRFDGYYVLADGLQIPNLAEESSRWLQGVVLRAVGFAVPREQWPAGVRPSVFVGYAFASAAYRTVVSVGLVYALATFFAPHRLEVLGLGLATAAALVLFGGPLYRLVQRVGTAGRLPDFAPARAWLALGGAMLVVGAFLTVPWTVTVQGRALLEVAPEHQQRVAVPATGGFLSEVLVRDGQPVRAGELLAVLTNPKLEIRLRLNEADQALRDRQQGTLALQLEEAGAEERSVAASLQQTAHELNALRSEHATVQHQCERLTLRAPCDGVVLGLCPREWKGKWLEKGIEVCRVGDPRGLRAVLLVEPSDQRRIVPGATAQVRVHGWGSRREVGQVTAVSPIDAARVPPQLAVRNGGEVGTEQDPVTREERPRQPHYLVAVKLAGEDAALQPGVLGRVKIETTAQTGWWRLRRFLGQTFHWGL